VIIDCETRLRSSESSKRIGPYTTINGENVEIRIPKEWFAYIFLLCSAAYFDLLRPLELARASGIVNEPPENDKQIVCQALKAIREYVVNGPMAWPSMFPCIVDEANPCDEAWMKVKTLYLLSMSTVLLHETSHILNDDHLTYMNMSSDQRKEIEHRCDLDAAQWLLSKHDGDMLSTCMLSLIIGFGATVIFNKNRPSVTHPDPLDRIPAVFTELDVEQTVTSLLLQTLINMWLLKILDSNTEEFMVELAVLFERYGANMNQVYDASVTRLRYL
jgi:hypothetical protein